MLLQGGSASRLQFSDRALRALNISTMTSTLMLHSAHSRAGQTQRWGVE